MEDNKELAVISQLAIITDRLEEVSEDIKLRTNDAMNLVCNEENLATIKKVRAEFNKEFTQYEDLRKTIKRKIMENYDKFEERYNTLIGNAFKTSDNALKSKINETENNIKSEKENELKTYFNELVESKNLENFINYDRLGIKVGMSDTLTKLIKQVNEKVESVEKDIKLIEMEDDKALAGCILTEYLTNGFDYSKAKLTTLNLLAEQKRIEQLKQEREQKEEIAQKIEEKIEQEIIIPQQIVENVDNPVENFTVKFEVIGTREQLVALREYMNENNLKFNNI